ncbi:MAG: DUF4363 family protein [Christensenellales bacterium]|nr:DUF4363 family protein [Christensenellales bacterium]
MSRKLTAMAVTLALLAALCLLEAHVVRRATGEAMAQTQQILADIRAGSLTQAKEKAHALDKTWDERASRLEIMVDHGSTDDVRYALSRLLAALEGEDRSAALIYACELEGSVEHVYERQAFTLENML